METLSISEISKAVEGKLVNHHGDIYINGICTRLKNIKEGYLYIPLVNTAYDFHSIIEDAYLKGALAVVVPKETDINVSQVVVDDNMEAFKKLCYYYRNKFCMPVIAVTGSCGKTSTKDMIASLLRQKYNNIVSNPGSYNTMPTIVSKIFSLDSNTDAFVIELGFSGYFNQIKRKVDILRPEIGIVTNISTSHFKNILSFENLLKAKMEIATYFYEGNVLIINVDDEYLSTIKNTPYEIIKISTLGQGDYNAQNIVNLGEDGVEFSCNYQGEIHQFKLTVPGVHNVYNALAAIAVGELFELDIAQVKKGIYNFESPWLRTNIVKLKNEITLINDCFNANFKSTSAGIDVLNSFSGERKIAILGDMLGLVGSDISEEYHRKIGKYLIDKCDMLIAVGNHSKYYYDEAKNHIQSKYFESVIDSCNYLKEIMKPKDVILIKGPRDMHMEYIAKQLSK